MEILNAEAMHRKFYVAHKHMAIAAETLHKLVVELTEAGRYQDARTQLRDVQARTAAARDVLDIALADATTARSDLIRLGGCSGECRE